MSFIKITSVTTASTSTNVVVNSSESLAGFQSGDCLFIVGHELPLVIASVSGSTITTEFPADTSLSAAEAVAVQTNAKLRTFLKVIETNNQKWATHFDPFLDWLSTSSATATMYDVLGNPITVTSVQGLSDMTATATTAADTLNTLEPRVTAAENTLSNVEATLSSHETNSAASASAAATSETNAATSATNAATSETNAQTWYNQAQSAVDSIGSVNKTMNFTNFSIDAAGNLIVEYNGVQDSSAFSINSNGELEVTI